MTEIKKPRARKNTTGKVKEEPKTIRPATDPINRENQMINLAIKLAEKQLMDGTASPSVINHFLKLGSRRDVLEREILEKQAKLIDAKAETIGKAKESEDLAKQAIEAIKSYNSGS